MLKSRRYGASYIHSHDRMPQNKIYLNLKIT